MMSITPEQDEWTVLLDSLGDASWRVRQVAVDRMAAEGSPEVISKVVEILLTAHRDLSRVNAAMQVLVRTEVDVVPSLLTLLSAKDCDTRAYVSLTLGDRGDMRAIPALVAALSDTNTNVRVHAMEALGKLQASAAVEPLMLAVESLDFEVAFPALDALAAIGDERITHRLLPLLDTPLLQTAIVESLGSLGDEEAIFPLLRLLKDSTVAPGVIAFTLQSIYHRHAARYNAGPTIVEILRALLDQNARSKLLSSIKDSTDGDAVAILWILGFLPYEGLEEALIASLESSVQRRAAIDALAQRGPSVVAKLLDCFNRSSREVQLSLIELCEHLADRRIVPLLLDCLGRDDEEIVNRTLLALARIGDGRAYQDAFEHLGHSDPRIRQAAVGLINAIGHPSTSADMLEHLRDPTSLNCDSAIRVAAYFGFPECLEALFELCECSDDRIARTAIEHLSCLDHPRVIMRLRQAATSDRATLRAATMSTLGEMDPADSEPILSQGLQDTNVWVRYFAARSLAQTGYRSETARLLEAAAMNDSAMQVRIAAVDSLSGQSLPTLIALANSEDEALATAALCALGSTHDPSALAVLLKAATVPQKRLIAIAALVKLGLSKAIPFLRDVALARDEVSADAAVRALGQIQSADSVHALIDVMAIPKRRPAAKTALQQHGPSSIAVLAQSLQSQRPDVRRTLVEFLILARSPEAMELLEATLADPDPALRHLVVAGLTHLPRIAHKPSGPFIAEGKS